MGIRAGRRGARVERLGRLELALWCRILRRRFRGAYSNVSGNGEMGASGRLTVRYRDSHRWCRESVTSAFVACVGQPCLLGGSAHAVAVRERSGGLMCMSNVDRTERQSARTCHFEQS
jgi:hypothetical protein